MDRLAPCGNGLRVHNPPTPCTNRVFLIQRRISVHPPSTQRIAWPLFGTDACPSRRASTGRRADMASPSRTCVSDAQHFTPAEPDDAQHGASGKSSVRERRIDDVPLIAPIQNSHIETVQADWNGSCDSIDRAHGTRRHASNDVTESMVWIVGRPSASRQHAAVGFVAIVKRSMSIRMREAHRTRSQGRWFEYCSIEDRNQCGRAAMRRPRSQPDGRGGRSSEERS